MKLELFTTQNTDWKKNCYKAVDMNSFGYHSTKINSEFTKRKSNKLIQTS